MSMDNPRTHAEREAAQRADEAELLCIHCASDDHARCTFRDCACDCQDEPPPDADLETRFDTLDDDDEAAGPPIAGGAPTCFYCEHHGDGVVPATQRVTFTDHGAPRAEWVCDACARAYFPEHTHPCPMAGGAPTPADDPAGPGATTEAARCTICKAGPVNPDDGSLCDPCWAHYNSHGDDPCPACPPFTEHTHPCPTCHQARPCTGTGCADGPRECATCSNCRGW